MSIKYIAWRQRPKIYAYILLNLHRVFSTVADPEAYFFSKRFGSVSGCLKNPIQNKFKVPLTFFYTVNLYKEKGNILGLIWMDSGRFSRHGSRSGFSWRSDPDLIIFPRVGSGWTPSEAVTLRIQLGSDILRTHKHKPICCRHAAGYFTHSCFPKHVREALKGH